MGRHSYVVSSDDAFHGVGLKCGAKSPRVSSGLAMPALGNHLLSDLDVLFLPGWCRMAQIPPRDLKP